MLQRRGSHLVEQLQHPLEGEMAVARECESGDFGPVLFGFGVFGGDVFGGDVLGGDVEVDPAVVAGVLGDFEAFVLFESALARGADPEGELEAAGIVVGRGEDFGAGLPGGRAKAGAAGGFGEREQYRVELFKDGLGGFALEGVDFFRAEFSRRRGDAEFFRQRA